MFERFPPVFLSVLLRYSLHYYDTIIIIIIQYMHINNNNYNSIL
jgi:hypothetical protein